MIYGIQYILLDMMCLLLIYLVKNVHHLATQVDEEQGQGPLSHDDQLLRGFRPGE